MIRKLNSQSSNAYTLNIDLMELGYEETRAACPHRADDSWLFLF